MQAIDLFSSSGILGYGAIGRQCARVAKAFGMDVIVYTMREKSTPEARKDDSYNVPGTGDPDGLIPSQWYSGTGKEELNEFLRKDIDLLVICLPLTSSTTGMIGKEQFQILSKKKTFISNIARGPIIDTKDFVDALESGSIKGAAVDVTDPEPLPKEHPLWKSPNIFVSPHVSWYSSGHGQRLLGILELNLGKLSEGNSFVNLVDKDLGF
jgi:phosphoglycerate dehydrogenase-like enzyme